MSIAIRIETFRQLFSWLLPPASPGPRRAGDDEGAVESAAALDGFSGPSNWLGWAAYGTDNLYPVDWGTDSADVKRRDRADNDEVAR